MPKGEIVEESPNKELWRKAEELLKQNPGMRVNAACKQVGIMEATFAYWRKQKKENQNSMPAVAKALVKRKYEKRAQVIEIPATPIPTEEKAMVIIASPGMLKNILREWL